MNAQILKQAGAGALFALSLLVLMAGYLASYTMKNGMFIIAGIVVGLILVIMASVLGESEEMHGTG